MIKLRFLLKARITLGLAIFLSPCFRITANVPGIQVLTFLRNPIPGNPGVEISSYSNPNFSESGHFIAWGNLTGDAVTSDTNNCVFLIPVGGEPQILIREGDEVGGVAPEGSTFRQPGRGLFVDNNGNVAFEGLINIPGENNSLSIMAAFRTSPPYTEVELLAYHRQKIGDQELWVKSVRLSPNGDFGINGSIGSKDSIWKGAPGAENVLITEDTSYSGMPTEGKFTRFETGFTINRDGDYFIGANLRWVSESSPFASADGLWIFHPKTNTVTEIIKDKDPAPGLEGLTVDLVSFNYEGQYFGDTGWLAWYGKVVGEGVTADNDQCFWGSHDGDDELIAREGSLAPGTDGTFGNVFTPEGITSEGVILFHNTLNYSDGSKVESLWTWKAWQLPDGQIEAGQLKLIAYEGQLVPGEPDLTILDLQSASLSPDGRVVFTAARSNNKIAAWITDSDGNDPKYLIGRDDLMPTSDGGITEVRSISLVETAYGDRFDSQGRMLASLGGSLGYPVLVLLDPDPPRVGISGTVFEDNDYNGELTGVDKPAAGVTVELFADGGAGEALESQATQIDGSYVFENMEVGSYVVKVSPPPGSKPVWDKTEPADDGLIPVSYTADSVNAGNDFLIEQALEYSLTGTLHQLNLEAVPVASLDLGLEPGMIDEPVEVTTDPELLEQLPIVDRGLIADGVSPLIIELTSSQPLPVSRILAVEVESIEGGSISGGMDSHIRVLNDGIWNQESLEWSLPKGAASTWLQIAPLSADSLSFLPDSFEISAKLNFKDVELETIVGTAIVLIRKPPIVLIHGENSDGSWGLDFLEVLENSRPDFIIPISYGTKPRAQLLSDHLSKNKRARSNAADSIFYLARVLEKQIDANVQLKELHERWTFVRYDVIGHSQGGILARMLAAQSPPSSNSSTSLPSIRPFRSAENFNRGRFHRIITLGSPHVGSRLVYYWERLTFIVIGQFPSFAGTLNEVLYKQLFETGESAVIEKWDPLGNQIQRLNDPKGDWIPDPGAKFHLIRTTILKGGYSAVKDGHTNGILFTSLLEPYGGAAVIPSGFDGFVDVASMEGRLEGDALSDNVSHLPEDDNLCHLSNRHYHFLFDGDAEDPAFDWFAHPQTHSAEVAQHLIKRLNASLQGEGEEGKKFGPFPPLRRYQDGDLELIDDYLAKLLLRFELSIQAPGTSAKYSSNSNLSNVGYSITQGGTYNLEFSPSDTYPMPDALAANWIAYRFGADGFEALKDELVVNEADSSKAALTIPNDIPGEYWVIVSYIAEDGTNVFSPAFLASTIDPPGAVPVSLKLVPDQLSFNIGESLLPQLIAEYSDGSVMVHSLENAVFSSSHPEVIDVSNFFAWKALEEGASTITATLNGMTAAAHWVVQNPAQSNEIPWESWRSAFFAEADLENLDISGPDADPDKDGATNLIEYVRASDPYRSDDFNTVYVDTVSEGDLNYAQVRFPLRDVLENISVTIQRSAGLGDWEDVLVATDPGALDSPLIINAEYSPYVSLFTLQDDVPLSEGFEERFYRLTAELIEP